MNPEIFHSSELNLPESRHEIYQSKALSQREIDSLYEERFLLLESVRQALSLKFYYKIKEKVGAEKQAFLELFDLQEKKKNILSNYSFVLDGLYFEQKFLNNSL